MEKHVTLVDFSDKIKASMSTNCDYCKAKLGEGWTQGKDNITLHLKNGKDAQGYDQTKTHHFCGEACLRGALNDRAKNAK